MKIEISDSEASAMCFAMGVAKRALQSIDIADGGEMAKCLTLMEVRLIAEGCCDNLAESLRRVKIKDMIADFEQGVRVADRLQREVA